MFIDDKMNIYSPINSIPNAMFLCLDVGLPKWVIKDIVCEHDSKQAHITY